MAKLRSGCHKDNLSMLDESGVSRKLRLKLAGFYFLWRPFMPERSLKANSLEELGEEKRGMLFADHHLGIGMSGARQAHGKVVNSRRGESNYYDRMAVYEDVLVRAADGWRFANVLITTASWIKIPLEAMHFQ
jgi:hypothetical protein